jgi:hypothetical protein
LTYLTFIIWIIFSLLSVNVSATRNEFTESQFIKQKQPPVLHLYFYVVNGAMNLLKYSLVITHIKGELRATVSETCYVFAIRVSSWWWRQNSSVKHPFRVCGLLAQESSVHVFTIKNSSHIYVNNSLYYLE